MANQLQLPSLGRPFNLGMLYDCRTEKLIPGRTLWGSQKLKSASQVDKQHSSTCKVITEDSIQEKSTTLGVDANLKLSLMCGLVTVEGAANYLTDHKTSKKQSRVTLQYTSTTHFEQLSMDQIGDIEFPDVLNDQDVTHVVAGIQYGANAFFVFDRSLEGAETMHDVHGKMEATITSISYLDGDACTSFKNVDKTETDKFRCKFYGDFILSSNPSSFDEAIKLYKDLPQRYTDDDTRSVPKLIYLTPLSKLCKEKSQQIISAISFDVTSQVEKIMEQFHDTEMSITDLLNHEVCTKFVDVKSQLKKLKDLLTRYKMSFTKNLAQILPKVRSAGEKEEKLAELISSVHASPFSSSAMGKHLHDKEKEINYLAQCLENAGKVPNIQFDFPNTDCHLAKLKYDFNIDQVACFGFNVTSDTSPYIQSLEHYLQTGKTKQIDQQEWFNTDVAKQLRSKLVQFVEFAKVNVSKRAISYVVTNADIEATEQLPSLIMYSSNESMPFDPPGRPGKPEASRITAKSVKLKWTASKIGGRVLSYKVVCMSSKTTTKELQRSAALATTLSIPDLTPAVTYNCWVIAMGDCYSAVASELCRFETLECTSEVTQSLADKFLRFSECVEPGAVVPVYKPPLELSIEDEANKLRKYEILLPDTPLDEYKKPEKILMLVGAIGAGKRTLINGLANHILGVTWEDDFRYKVITDEGSGFSQTKYITAYSFRTTNMDYNLTVVDTPGFGDTEEYENDWKIAEQIKKFILDRSDIMCSIEGIGFITQASLARLTPTQRFIFTSLFAIFGRDISDNIFLMTTFADDNTPLVLEAVKQAIIPYRDSFKFNNSALYAANDSSQATLDSLLWKMGHRSFCEFFELFSRAGVRDFAFTRKVLREWEQISKLQDQIRISWFNLDKLKQEAAILNRHEADLSKGNNFEYSIEVTAFRKKDLEPGVYTTTCQICNVTCNNNHHCKRGCCAMNSSDKCTVCPQKCHWSDHLTVPYMIEYYTKQETCTSDDLKRRCNLSEHETGIAEALMAKNKEMLFAERVKVHKNIEKLRQIIITSRPVSLTKAAYLDILIKSEKQEKKHGWEERVETLYEFRRYSKDVDSSQCLIG